MTDERQKKRLLRLTWLLLLATLCFIWGNSLIGRAESAGLSGRLYLLLRSIGIPVPSEHFLRKLAHFCEFGALGAELSLLFLLLGGWGAQSVCNSAFAGLLAAVTDEALQLLSLRGSAVADVLLDFAGALTGIFVLRLIALPVRRRRKT